MALFVALMLWMLPKLWRLATALFRRGAHAGAERAP